MPRDSFPCTSRLTIWKGRGFAGFPTGVVRMPLSPVPGHIFLDCSSAWVQSPQNFSWTPLVWGSSIFPLGFPGGAVVKNLSANAGDARSIPESGRSPGGGDSNLLQYSFRGNPMDRGVWWVTKSWTWLSNWACMHASFHWYSNLADEMSVMNSAVLASKENKSKPLILVANFTCLLDKAKLSNCGVKQQSTCCHEGNFFFFLSCN